MPLPRHCTQNPCVPQYGVGDVHCVLLVHVLTQLCVAGSHASWVLPQF